MDLKKILLFFMLFSFYNISAQEVKKTVCLNMIVKNEKDVIKRSLGSVKGIIDYWVILDTGSTDGTQEIIKEFMKDIPGELHEDPFRNFEYSRNKALDFAKGKADYILFMDADEEFTYDPGFKMPPLALDYYYIIIKHGSTVYNRTSLISDKFNWRWKGVLHEYVSAPGAVRAAVIPGITNIYRSEGARSRDPQKYQKDAEILEEAVKLDPHNQRDRFYLARSYSDAGNKEKALENFRKVVEMNGWDEEVYYSMVSIGHIEKELKMPPEKYLKSFLDAYLFRPTRGEAVYYIANYYREKGDNLSAYLWGSLGTKIKQPKDILFVQKWVYDWGIPLEKSVGAYWIDCFEECRDLSLQMLKLPDTDLPESTRKIVNANLNFALKKIDEKKNNLEKEKLQQDKKI